MEVKSLAVYHACCFEHIRSCNIYFYCCCSQESQGVCICLRLSLGFEHACRRVWLGLRPPAFLRRFDSEKVFRAAVPAGRGAHVQTQEASVCSESVSLIPYRVLPCDISRMSRMLEYARDASVNKCIDFDTTLKPYNNLISHQEFSMLTCTVSGSVCGHRPLGSLCSCTCALLLRTSWKSWSA